MKDFYCIFSTRFLTQNQPLSSYTASCTTLRHSFNISSDTKVMKQFALQCAPGSKGLIRKPIAEARKQVEITIMRIGRTRDHSVLHSRHVIFRYTMHSISDNIIQKTKSCDTLCIGRAICSRVIKQLRTHRICIYTEKRLRHVTYLTFKRRTSDRYSLELAAKSILSQYAVSRLIIYYSNTYYRLFLNATPCKEGNDYTQVLTDIFDRITERSLELNEHSY